MNTTPTAKIAASDLYKSYVKDGELVHALSDVHVRIEPGEFVALVGPSGCGKSTLLNLIAGIDVPVSGTLLYDDLPLNGANRRVGYMTQSDTVLPWRTALQNVEYPLELRSLPKAERRARAEHWLEIVGLQNFRNHYPRELSGGMRKRVLLARTLVYDPDCILLDEPFGALDAQTRMVMQAELMRLWSAANAEGGKPKTVVLVTHDLNEAVALADRVFVFGARPGRIKFVERIEIPQPRDVFSVRFTPRFAEYFERLWGHLEDEMLQSQEV